MDGPEAEMIERQQQLDEEYERILSSEKKEVVELESEILETILDYFNIIKAQWNLSGDLYGSNPDFIRELRSKKEATDKHLEEAEIEATVVPPSLTRQKSITLLK